MVAEWQSPQYENARRLFSPAKLTVETISKQKVTLVSDEREVVFVLSADKNRSRL